jgi:hypothetical protein
MNDMILYWIFIGICVLSVIIALIFGRGPSVEITIYRNYDDGENDEK